MGDRRFRCLARDTKTNRVVPLYRKQGGGFTRNPKSKVLAKTRPPWFTEAESREAVKWGEKHGLAVWATKDKYPFLVVPNGVLLPSDDLSRRLNEVGKRLGRYIKILSGNRSAYQAWDLRMRYLRGQGNLAALCCGNSGYHSWAACGKSPRSNHAAGRAADCGVVHSGRSVGYTSIGLWPKARDAMRAEGLCLPVGCGCQKEAWHAEVGSRWCA